MAWSCAPCGGENPGGTRFCGHCGQLREDAASPPPASTPPFRTQALVGVPVSAPRTDLDERVTRELEEVGRLLAPADATLVEMGQSSFLERSLADRLVGMGRMVEERRMVTAVFADVSGFTALADGLDAEQLVEIIDPIVSLISEIVGRYEGYVGKFAGDAILAFFGAPVAHEDDPLRALLAARDMQVELGALLASLPAEGTHLTLHVGVNTGDVVAGFFGGQVRMDYSILGDAVNVAQRLEAAAPGGCVYVGEATYQLTRDQLDFEPVGELTVKGKPEPVRAWSLVVDAAAPGAGQPPVGAGARAGRTGGADGSQAPLLGRDRELEGLDGTFESCRGGRPAVVGIVAEPGVGKSRLLEEAARRAQVGGFRWLSMRGISYGAALAYWPFAETVRTLLGVTADDRGTSAVERSRAVLADLGVSEGVAYLLRLVDLPVDGEASGPHGDTAEDFRWGLVEALGQVLAGMAARGPVVLAVEDVHWLDPSSAALLVDLAAWLAERPAPVAIALTSRTEGRAAVERCVSAAGAGGIIDLAPLDRPAVEALAGHLLEGAAPEVLIDALVDRTDGNPLFVQEVVRSLVDARVLRRGATGWSLRPGWDAEAIPTSIEKVLAARIDLLPRQAAAVLQLAAVIGRRVLYPLLEVVCPEELSPLGVLIDQLVAAGFLDRGGDGNLTFHHALMVDAAYNRLLRNRRREVHRQLAEAGERLFGRGDELIDLLARHAYLGEMGAHAVGLLDQAAIRARRLHAVTQAIDWLAKAVEVARREVGADDRLPDLLLELAELKELNGELDDALSLYSEVRAQTRGIRAFTGQASVLRKKGDYARALEVIGEARAAHPDAGPEDRAALALIEGWVLGSMTGQMESAIPILEDALGLVTGRGLPIEGELLLILARWEEAAGLHDRAVEHGQRALEQFESTGDLARLVTALRILGHALLGVETPDRSVQVSQAVSMLQRGMVLADRVGDVEERAACLLNLGRAYQADGRLEEGVDCDRQALAAFRELGIEGGAIIACCNLSDKLWLLGRLDEAEAVCLEALDLAGGIGDRLWVAEGTDNLAKIMLAKGELHRAAQLGAEAAEMLMSLGNRQEAAVAWEVAAEAHSRLGDPVRAAEMITAASALRSEARAEPEPA